MLKFYGRNEPVFSISQTEDNLVILDDLTLNITLIGSVYDGEPMKGFLEDLRQIEMTAIPMN